MRNRIPFGLLDLFVGLFLCVLIGGIGVSTIQGARDVDRRAKCASNLHQLGLAILLYQNENGQSYPRTVMDQTGAPKPVWGTPYQAEKNLGPIENTNAFDGKKGAPAANDVTASLFLLIRVEQLPPASFICPSTMLKAWDFGGDRHNAQEFNNWTGNDGLAQHLSYSYQNPYPSNAAIANGFQLKNPDATFAVAADMNPGGDGPLKVTLQSPNAQMRTANSLNHKGDGQNVLYGDGHVEWMKNPFCGTQHDNIYTAFGPEVADPHRKTSVILSSSYDGMDSILLPTAADIGYAGHPKGKPLGDADVARLKKDIQGTYSAPFDKENVYTLTVDEKTLKCEVGRMTILYQYQVTGTEDGALLLKLTAPKTKTTGMLILDGNNLSIDIEGEFPLGMEWKRADGKTHAQP